MSVRVFKQRYWRIVLIVVCHRTAVCELVPPSGGNQSEHTPAAEVQLNTLCYCNADRHIYVWHACAYFVESRKILTFL